MSSRVVINEYIDLVWKGNKPVIFVAGKEFLHCSFLAVSLPAADAARIESIDELANDDRARSLEGKDAMEALGMSVDDVMQAHASNLIAWVENGYDTRILHSNLSFPLLKQLAKSGDEKASRVLRGEIRDRLASGSRNVAIMLIDCCEHYIDDESLVMLAASEHAYVRRHVAVSLRTPAAALGRLAGDLEVEVRLRVASNANTPPSALEKLAGDVDGHVRRYVANNWNTPAAALVRLAGDRDHGVLMEVAHNPKVSSIVLEKLAGVSDRSVRHEVAKNPNTTVAVLERLAGDVWVEVRREVADNPNTPVSVLERLADDKVVQVRYTVAKNPNTTVAVLERLAGDVDAEVRREVASNPNTPPAVAKKAGR